MRLTERRMELIPFIRNNLLRLQIIIAGCSLKGASVQMSRKLAVVHNRLQMNKFVCGCIEFQLICLVHSVCVAVSQYVHLPIGRASNTLIRSFARHKFVTYLLSCVCIDKFVVYDNESEDGRRRLHARFCHFASSRQRSPTSR